MKKILALVLCLMMVMSALTFASAETAVPTIDQIKLGEDYTDLTATVKWLTHRTDLVNNGAWANYMAEFNKVYPNITVEIEGITDYAQDSLIRLTSDKYWGTMMGIPQVEASEYSKFFICSLTRTPAGSLRKSSTLPYTAWERRRSLTSCIGKKCRHLGTSTTSGMARSPIFTLGKRKRKPSTGQSVKSRAS